MGETITLAVPWVNMTAEGRPTTLADGCRVSQVGIEKKILSSTSICLKDRK